MKVDIDGFKNEDAKEIVALIHRAMFETNITDYSKEDLIENAKAITEVSVTERASWTHFYVFRADDKIVGTGAIGPYWGSEIESSFFTIFVLPEYQGQGIGHLIIHILESDEYYKRAHRIEIPASITAVPFYERYGYVCKCDNKQPDDEGSVRMEKYRSGNV